MIKITQSQLKKAVDNHIIEQKQAASLWEFLQENYGNKNNLIHVFYYLGGLIAIAAMTIFFTFNLNTIKSEYLLLITLVYMIISYLMTLFFARKHFPIPAALTSTLTLALVPLLVYSIQLQLGLWDDTHTLYQDYHHLIKSHWLPMEIATLLVGSLLYCKHRYPFLMFFISATLLYLSMDLAALITDNDSWEQRQMVSIVIGLSFILITFFTDLNSNPNNPIKPALFWLYIFGALSFWLPLSTLDSDSELGKFIYFMINLILIFTGSFLQKKVFIILGALGSMMYLSYLAYSVFADTLWFSLILSIIGLVLLFCGVLLSKYYSVLASKFETHLPPNLRY